MRNDRLFFVVGFVVAIGLVFGFYVADYGIPGSETFDVLSVGGGEYHDYDWYERVDTETLEEVGANVRYTESTDEIASSLDTTDVLYLSNNQPLEAEEIRSGIFEHVNRGKGLLIFHSASWYNWDDWPEFYRVLVGGGTSHHPPYGEFEVTVEDGSHPVMNDVPEMFTVEDELYHFEQDPEGTPINVLASGTDPETGEDYPVVWVVQHYNGRIVVNTLGHDGASHEHPAYQQILQNSALWAARKME